MMLHNPIRRLAAPFALAAIIVLFVPGLVLGHAELETATPADKSRVTEPVVEVSGIYSEAMTPDGSSLVVRDTSGTVVARGTVDPEDDTRMVATPETPLGGGKYVVASTAVATDGHVERTTWTFTVAIPSTPSPSPEETASPTEVPTATATATAAGSVAPTPSPTALPASQAPSLSPAPSPSGDGTNTGSGSDVVLPILVALIVLGAGAAYLLTRHNRPIDPTDPA